MRGAGFPIVSDPRRAYLLSMLARRLVRILAIFAILLAPMSMMASSAAMAQPTTPESALHHEQSAAKGGHCAEMSGENQKDDGSATQQECLSDCAVTCAAIPVFGDPLRDPDLLLTMAHPVPLVNWMRGLNPESADPPPRTA